MNPRGAAQATALALVLAAVALAGCATTDAQDETPVKTDKVVIPGTWIFTPKVIEVANGTTVTWTNNGAAPHTVTIDGVLDINLDPGQSATFTFDQPGTFNYYCKYHPPDMVGTVIVS